MSRERLEMHWRVLKSVYPGLPRQNQLGQEMIDAEVAQARGYYLPDEDERLRLTYLRYLRSRTVLWEMIYDLKPLLKKGDLHLFSLAFCAAAALVRSARFLVQITRGRPVVHQKLDEAEPRFGIPRKSFTRIFKGLGDPVQLWRFQQARGFYQRHRKQIHEELNASGLHDLVAFLEEEEPMLQADQRGHWTVMLSYRLYSMVRRSRSGYQQAAFQLFRLSGQAIGGRRQPFVSSRSREKRVSPETVAEIETVLEPGDILVTRHDDALSNLFLPGFWPHSALYLGTPRERREMSLPDQGPEEGSVLEAKKDGVRFRPLAETLRVDLFVVLRPRVSPSERREIIGRAITHEGKLYDFLFDFRGSERLACTEVIYRSFHGTGCFHYNLVEAGGRLTLPAVELIGQSLAGNFVETIAIFGVIPGPIVYGEEAATVLESTLEATPRRTALAR